MRCFPASAGLNPDKHPLTTARIVQQWIKEVPIMDPNRRNILTTGVAATVMAATPQVFAQQTGPAGATMRFYEKGPTRIRYAETGSGFPLLLIAGGALNSRMAGLVTSPFNPIEEFKNEYRCIFADLRNAN